MSRIATLALLGLTVLSTGCTPAGSQPARSAMTPSIGILQCDEYLSKVAACLRHPLPAARRGALAEQARQTFRVWKEATTHPQHRDALPLACSIALEQASDELRPLGCAM